MTLDKSAIADIKEMRRWLGQFLTDEFIADVARRTGKDASWCGWALATFTNEAAVFAPTVAQHLRPGDRVLEVGSGIGFLSIWLHRNGVEIRGLDPAPGPFNPFTAIAEAVADRVGENRPPTMEIGAEELNPGEHGLFDLIFSFNVLEHVAKLGEAFDAMSGVLAPGGRMLHSCPNYAVPYEPHLSIPLIPGSPKLTERVFRAAVTQQHEVWESLNFITLGDVRRLAKRNGLAVAFARGMLHDRVERLWTDPEFSSRHFGSPAGRLVRTGLNLARRLGFTGLLRYLPAGFATPMLFIAEKPEAAP